MATDLVLVESKSARDERMSRVTDDRASEVLSKAKGLIYFAQVGSDRLATNEQMAEFYEVPIDTIRSAFKNSKDEFESDGVKAFRGKALKDVRSMIDLSANARHAVLWNPRGGLRLGLVLRDSPVAKLIRDQVLDLAEADPTPITPIDDEFANDPIIIMRRRQLAQEQKLKQHDQEIEALKAQQLAIAQERHKLQEQMLALEQERLAAAQRLKALPPATNNVPQESLRDKIRRIVNDYCTANSANQREVWNVLYQQYHYRYHKRPNKAEGDKSRLDTYARLGLIDSLYDLAHELFVVEVA